MTELSSVRLPSLVLQMGSQGQQCFLEFFTVQIANHNTREAYARATRDFLLWCETESLDSLNAIRDHDLARYLDNRSGSAATKRLHLAALRALFRLLASRRLIAGNPASGLRVANAANTAKNQRNGLSLRQAANILESIPSSTLAGSRDRALLALLLYGAMRISEAIELKVDDVRYADGRVSVRSSATTQEQGFFRLPQAASRYLRPYVETSTRTSQSAEAYLFRSLDPRGAQCDRPLTRNAALKMVRRRSQKIGLGIAVNCDSFRLLGASLRRRSARQRTVRLLPNT